MKNNKYLLVALGFAASIFVQSTSSVCAMPENIACIEIQLEFDQELKNALDQKLVRVFKDCCELYNNKKIPSAQQLKKVATLTRKIAAHLKKKENLHNRRLKKIVRNNNRFNNDQIEVVDDELVLLPESQEMSASDNSSSNNNKVPEERHENLSDFTIIELSYEEPVNDKSNEENIGVDLVTEPNEDEDQINKEENQATGIPPLSKNQKAFRKKCRKQRELQNIRTARLMHIEQLARQQRIADQQRIEEERAAAKVQIEEQVITAKAWDERDKRRAHQAALAEEYLREQEAYEKNQAEMMQQLISDEQERQLEEQYSIEQAQHQLVELAQEEAFIEEAAHDQEALERNEAEVIEQYQLEEQRKAEERRQERTLKLNEYCKKIIELENSCNLVYKKAVLILKKYYYYQDTNTVKARLEAALKTLQATIKLLFNIKTIILDKTDTEFDEQRRDNLLKHTIFLMNKLPSPLVDHIVPGTVYTLNLLKQGSNLLSTVLSFGFISLNKPLSQEERNEITAVKDEITNLDLSCRLFVSKLDEKDDFDYFIKRN